MKESHTKSILKSISWRIVATSITILLAYVFTGEINTALKIGGLEFFGKIVVYYIHERIWARYNNVEVSK